MLLNYPDIPEGLVVVSNIFSILKSSFSTLFYTTLLILMIIAGVKKLKMMN
ncbi:MAG: hypothetical protein IPI12_03330 [Ignavibacteriales bacterium]|jgi:hypothetical protein|nr:hypothetical protein [Ignavibacteriales bacterium]MBK7265373.1 hypothetical protein [Ignavibacteriales bacterium]MBK8663137.1 hypothetical protein [Ignavibacteriales bacterium]MBP7543795.1 hypothetical protein [Ignavibacteriaceae bacterium]